MPIHRGRRQQLWLITITDDKERVVEALARLGHPLVTIGGDHGLAFPIIRGVARARGGRIGVISVDAHLDVRISHHGEKSSGVPFRYMLEELGDQIAGRNFAQFGIGGWLNTKSYREYLREHDVRVVTAREIYKGDFDALVAEAIERAADGTDAIYMTFDIDAVEGATVGGTNVPAIAGLSPYQALELVWEFGRHPEGDRLRRDGGLAAVGPVGDVGADGRLAGAELHRRPVRGRRGGGGRGGRRPQRA